MTKKTRFKLAMVVLIFLGSVTIYALSQEAMSVAGSCITGIMTVAMLYIAGDSYRKSNA